MLPLLMPLLLPLPLLMPIVLIMLRAALPVVRPLHWHCHVALLYLRELPKCRRSDCAVCRGGLGYLSFA